MRGQVGVSVRIRKLLGRARGLHFAHNASTTILMFT